MTAEENRKLYVCGLPDSTTERLLRGVFEAVGKVTEVVVPRDRTTNAVRGFAFVTMGTPEEAKQALSRLHNSHFEGRNLAVRPFEPSTRDSDSRGSDGGYNDRGRPSDTRGPRVEYSGSRGPDRRGGQRFDAPTDRRDGLVEPTRENPPLSENRELDTTRESRPSAPPVRNQRLERFNNVRLPGLGSALAGAVSNAGAGAGPASSNGGLSNVTASAGNLGMRPASYESDSSQGERGYRDDSRRSPEMDRRPGERGGSDNRTLRLGNLPYDCSRELIESLFVEHGIQLTRLNLPAGPDGRIRFGFASLATEEEARRAADRLNGIRFQGRSLAVSIATPRPPGPRPQAPMGGGPVSGPAEVRAPEPMDTDDMAPQVKKKRIAGAAKKRREKRWEDWDED